LRVIILVRLPRIFLKALFESFFEKSQWPVEKGLTAYSCGRSFGTGLPKLRQSAPNSLCRPIRPASQTAATRNQHGFIVKAQAAHGADRSSVAVVPIEAGNARLSNFAAQGGPAISIFPVQRVYHRAVF
jgi:hypothetical protein